MRGDVDTNGNLDLTDGVRVLGFLFLGSPAELPCLDAADANDSGTHDLTDGIYILNYLFVGGAAPPAPFPDCGEDLTPDAFDCALFAPCPIVKAPMVPIVDPVATPTNESPVTISGRADPSTRVEILGGAAPVLVLSGLDGRFEAQVHLIANRLNRLFVRARDDDDRDSPSATVVVTHDAAPPSIHIDEPRDGSEVIETEVTVTGRVADLHSGFLGLEVTVNGQPANVVVGIGTNGSYERAQVPLELGENTITAVAIDAVGNVAERSVTVIRRACEGSCIEAVSGSGQGAPIHGVLAEPIVVRMTQPDGAPYRNKIVDFKVTRSDGRLSTSPGDEPSSMHVQVRTDDAGMARAYWQLGSDAGCGNNRVVATSAGVDGRALFCASASPGPASQINVGSGNNQRAETGGPAPEPLVAWVNDSCNGVAGVPVVFTVERGGGKVNGQNSVTVVTSRTGHASVELTLGEAPGNQVISADFEGNVRPPAVFVAYALERRELGETAFRGVVLDNAQQPIGGADCHIVFATGELASTTSAIDGSFSFVALEGSGPAKLFVDGLTATRLGGVDGEDIPAGSFPSLTFDIVVVSQAENSLPGPVLLPRLDPANAVVYDGTTDVELTVDGIEGLRMLVRAGSMRRANGTIPTPADPAILRLNHVHHDDVPMPMPDGAAPPFAWTLQPGGAQFDPPIEITYPNMSGLPAGAASYFLTFNHDTGRFEIVASGRVSEDGSTITSDPGSGLTLAGWGCNCPPYSVTGDCDDDPCEDSKNFMNDQCEATAGSGAGALNCQLACLANSACNPNSPPWVRCTINDYADNRRRGNHGPAEGFCRRIPSWIPTIVLPGVAFNAGDICFAVDGTAHLFNELVPTWTRKCNEVSDGEHNAFLFGTLVPCLLSNNHMSPPFRALGAGTVPLVANIAREIIQATCGDGGGNGIDGGVPPIPDPDDLFVTEIAEASQLRVEAEDDVFYVRVGEPISLRVTRRSDGANLTSAATGTQYFGVLAPRDGSDREIVAITGDGVLTVIETPSPFAAVPVPFLVAVGNGEDLGLGQFAVIDADSDGDLLGDSYEELVGLDPDTPSQDDDDADEDGISDLSEALLGSSPTVLDTDGDGVSDGAEVRQGSDPLDPSSRFPSFALPPRGISVAGGRGAEDCPPDAPPVVTVNGQSVTVEDDGSFRVANIAAPDLFGPDGPGTRPDFLSDDPVRAVAVFTRDCRTYWAFSEPFQIRQGETFNVDDMTVTDRPPPLPEKIRIDAETTLVEVGESVQLTVTATLGDGSELDVTEREAWTVYRTSNPSVASVGPDGLVSGNGAGIVHITAVNEATTAVKRITVTVAAITTIIEGKVELEDGTAVSGAVVRTPFGAMGTSDGSGLFSFEASLPSERLLSVSASAVLGDETFTGVARDVTPVAEGVTDVGVIVLRPGLSGEWLTRAPLPTARGALCAATLPDGIHVLGGDFGWGGASPFTVHEVYDPVADSWSLRAPVPDNNLWGVKCAVVDGKIYLVGGWRSGGTFLREYNPDTDSWTSRTPVPDATFTWGHAAAAVGSEIIVIGGTCGPCVRIYDVPSDAWRQGAPIPTNASSLAAAAIGGKVFVVGAGTPLQIYDVSANEWIQGPDLLVATRAPSATVFGEKLYVFGGATIDPTSGGDLRAVQVFDPISDAWSELAEMPTNRSWSAAAATDTSIHVFGGFNLLNVRIDTHEEMR